MNKQTAVFISRKHADKKTLVVDYNKNVYANCNVSDICDELENDNVKFHILKGERTLKPKPKPTKATKNNTEKS